MSGLLTGILTAVAIVATVVSGGTLGIVAGALLAASYAANKGWLGKGAQRFAQSGVGKDLTMAIGLASAGLGVAGAMGAALPGTAAASVSTANAAAEGAGAASDAAASSADVAGQAAAASAPAAGTGANVADTAAIATPSGTLAQTMTDANGVVNSTLAGNPEAGLVQGSNTVGAASDAQAVQAGTAGTGGLQVPPGDSATVQQTNDSLGINTQAQTQSQNTAATQTAVNPNGSSAGNQAANIDESSLQKAAGSTDTAPAAQGGPTAQPGALAKLGAGVKSALSTPQGMLMAGQAVSGWAQGKAQENINQRQLAAQQWGNTQWMDPNQVSQMQAAAAAPVNVPMGYLNRAAAVRNLMNSGTTQTAPLQAAPAPALPTPGAGLANGGPIPAAGMNAQPRGGVI